MLRERPLRPCARYGEPTMNTAGRKRIEHILTTILCTHAALAANVAVDETATISHLPDRTVVTLTQSGTVTVTEGGSFEVLLVGGGGGGGGLVSSDTSATAGGGGAGGVIHLQSLDLTAGTYEVVIGAGGAVWDTDENAAKGKPTTAFGYTAYGGGPGGKALNMTSGGRDGASGGGNSSNYGTKGYIGKAVHSADGNLGHDGGDSAGTYSGGGGGGGAGTAANGNKGGDGYACSITGTEVYYAGGGGGYTDDTNGLGGGNGYYGGGGRMNRTGGNGIVILSFTTSTSFRELFNDGEGGVKTKGRDSRGDFILHTFTENGSFSLPLPGKVEVLLVGGGGGGGGGASGQDVNARAGGGGGGGVIHKAELLLDAGTYPIVIGHGGAKNMGQTGEYDTYRGGATTAFGLTAYGGGYGAMSLNFTNGGDGASGGGNSRNFSAQSGLIGKAIYGEHENLGHDGAAAVGVYGGGGGGGGAGTAADGKQGGDGYSCSISGAVVYYGGGGGGDGVDSNGLGGGNTSFGGGGLQKNAGGAGVVIVRYARLMDGTTVFVR